MANAAETINDTGALACINDKWDEKEVDKGHKLVDYAGRCINIPADPAAPRYTEDCVGKYEYMPDAKDTISDSFEEGSHLKDYTYKITGGTGKYQGASGGGTYFSDQLRDTLAGGTYKGTIQLP